MKHLAISVAILILPTALHAAQPAATPPAKQGGAIIGQQNSAVMNTNKQPKAMTFDISPLFPECLIAFSIR